MTEKESVLQIIERVREKVCDELCPYRESSGDEGVCDYIREHGECPLDELG